MTVSDGHLRIVPDHEAAGRAGGARAVVVARRQHRSGVAQRGQNRSRRVRCAARRLRCRRGLIGSPAAIASRLTGSGLGRAVAASTGSQAGVRLGRVDVGLEAGVWQVQPGDLRRVLLQQRPPALVAGLRQQLGEQ